MRPKNSTFNNFPAFGKAKLAEKQKTSWWINAPRENFTKFVEDQQLPKMQESKEGKRILNGGGAEKFK